MAPSWTLANLPHQSGKTFVVTGATSGLGRVAALCLARAGAHVALVGRSEAKLDDTRRAILDACPKASLATLTVDLADFSSILRGAESARAWGPIDVLINNAGVMATGYARTRDGLELQLATNHFAPFLLTGLLLDQLAASGAGRVVAVSSMAHRAARRAPVEDPRVERPYRKWQAYAESKLANLLFTYELDRRLAAAKLPVMAMAAHPGYSATGLAAQGRFGRTTGGAASIMDAVVKATGQPASRGALPILMAATEELPGSSYCGPDGIGEVNGRGATIVSSSALSHDRDAQRRLWELSEQTVGLRYP